MVSLGRLELTCGEPEVRFKNRTLAVELLSVSPRRRGSAPCLRLPSWRRSSTPENTHLHARSNREA